MHSTSESLLRYEQPIRDCMARFCILIFLLFMGVAAQYCDKWHQIKPGDTCYKILTTTNSTMDFLREANPGLNCDNLQIGETICTSLTKLEQQCAEWASVRSPEQCYKIREEKNLSVREFRQLNPDVNCDGQNVWEEICVKGVFVSSSAGPTTNSTSQNHSDFECMENYTIVPGDICFRIWDKYGLNATEFGDLNPSIDCNKINQNVCVSATGCSARHSVSPGDTCSSISTRFKLYQEELKALNPNLDCDKLVVGRLLCVSSVAKHHTMNSTCTKKMVIKAGDSCWGISQDVALTVDELLFLNPRISCDNLQIGWEICTHAVGSQSCSKFRHVADNETCASIATSEGISNYLFFELNPTVDCSRIERYSQICVGSGYFEVSKCVDSIRVQKDGMKCEQITKMKGMSQEKLQKLNPILNCQKELTRNWLVCTQAISPTMSTGAAREKLIDSLSEVSSKLVSTYVLYKAEPNEENERLMYQVLLDELVRDEVYATLKTLYQEDSEIKQILDSSVQMDRDELCKSMQNTSFSTATKTCVCDSKNIFIYCQIKAIREVQEQLKLADTAHLAAKRTRRTPGCRWIHPEKLSKKKKNPSKDDKTPMEQVQTLAAGCFGGECSIPFSFLELSLSHEMCVPLIQFTRDTITFCENEKTCDDAIDGNNIAGLKTAADRGLKTELTLCLAGLKELPQVLKAFGLSACLTLVKAEYIPLRGTVDVGGEINLAVLKLTGGAVVKAHDVLFPSMCEHEEFSCEDYCLFRKFDKPNGHVYGYLKVKLFSVFGIEGVTIVNEKFNAPHKVGCFPDMETSVILRNERTCENSTIWVQCKSKDDTIDIGELIGERGFSFKQNFWHRTLFYCTFATMDGQRMAFDVYGGKSKLGGKGNFYYAVRDDGIYFGKDKNRQDKLKELWDKKCEDPKNTENYFGGNEDSSEPTGTSSKVPAAACGKRIVGYYTGWGERTITPGQLLRLTHVIFAFVATYPDGTVKFGPVSDDDSSENAVRKAEERFVHMKKLGRMMNSGVKILFAVGGWDNSQHFSSIAMDSNKRKTFITSICSFIKKHGIDGVDIDWEYPVFGGAKTGIPEDRENLVTLLQELRAALTVLQEVSVRRTPYELTMAVGASESTIRPGYDLKEIMKYVDYLNVMSYDYYGAWNSSAGEFTGPPSPLYFGCPKGYSGKLNADFTMKFYSCRSGKPSKLTMGVPFYGRFWENVGSATEGDSLWRKAILVDGMYKGGFAAWRNIGNEGWNLGAARMHQTAKSPHIWNAKERKYLGFENQESLKHKSKYAIDKNLGGMMMWAIDFDDDSDTLLDIIATADLCSKGSGDDIKYDCVPIDEVRWWIPENAGKDKQGMCGKLAPLINGYYPVCDPDDPGYACCSPGGYCGSGEKYCDCEGCVNYRKNPKHIVNEPMKPTRPVQWHTEEGKKGRCGKDAPLLNGQMAICNPDLPSKACCSNGGYCGSGELYCDCNGCVDYSKQ